MVAKLRGPVKLVPAEFTLALIWIHAPWQNTNTWADQSADQPILAIQSIGRMARQSGVNPAYWYENKCVFTTAMVIPACSYGFECQNTNEATHLGHHVVPNVTIQQLGFLGHNSSHSVRLRTDRIPLHATLFETPDCFTIWRSCSA